MTENRQASWEVVHLQGNYSITQPVLAILSNRDPVADWVSASHVLQTTQFIPHLTMKVLDGAHWVHLENPDKVNSAMRDWLDYTLPPVARLQSTADARRVDEL
ncbi:hypothetical protein AX16_000211 [Volvariella volvacea WC 439]|nr:hypothetical protein AX16_000211 [Volvariella volvacea WC 439]